MRSSFPMAVERGRIRVALAALCAMAALAAVATVAPSPAHAAFTLKECEGSPITGEGSSLQKLAQANWKEHIFDTTIFGGCGASAPVVTFTTASSGCGLDALGAGASAGECKGFSGSQTEWEKPGYRDANIRFGAADFAPDPTEKGNIDDGPTGAGTPGAGEVHVIPVAGAAITVVAHFPSGCVLKSPGTGTPASGAATLNNDVTTGGVNDPTGAPTGDLYSNQTTRVHIGDQKLEEIWQGDITKWGEIVPEADFLAQGTHEAGKAPSTCAGEPIYRIVREDTSGTTYNFKHFLALLPFTGGGGAALWTGSSTVGTENTAWPVGGEEKAPGPVNSSTNVCEEAIHICRSKEGSGGSLSNAVIATSGSLGYLDLATAREKGYNMAPNPTGEPGGGSFEEVKNDREYWIPLEAVEPPATENGVGKVDPGVFVEPTAEAKAHFSGGNETKGADCFGADYRNIPTKAASPNEDPTLADWSKAIATGGTAVAIATAPTTAYPVCAITYDLAFDDDAPVYGNNTTEEAGARTVKDYLTSVVSSDGQGDLPEFDYAALPLGIVQDAQTGVAAIGWNKSAGASSGNNSSSNSGGSKSSSSSSSAAASSSPIAAVAPPSNAFSIAGAKVKGKDIVLSLVLPDAGTVQIKATGGGLTVSSVSASVGGGQGTVTLPISSAALKKIAKSKSKRLAVTISVTFTPTGGTAASQTKQLTVTQAAITAKPAAKKKKRSKQKRKKR
jgi:hypothetical protein